VHDDAVGFSEETNTVFDARPLPLVVEAENLIGSVFLDTQNMDFRRDAQKAIGLRVGNENLQVRLLQS
jgi:hypothetical protein